MANTHIGFNTGFHGKNLAFPKVDAKLLAPRLDGKGHELKYTHYSAFVHKERRLPIMTSVNIKGEAYNAHTREGKEPWDFSDQVDEKYQIGQSFYGNDENTFDRGHLVRRVDPCWGSKAIADQADLDTFKWVNCTPQHNKLNRNGGVWLQLEQHVMEHGVKNKVADVSVFAGPVLDKSDRVFKKQYKKTDVPIPIVFWKVIVWKKADGELYAVGFMMSQWEWVKSKLLEKGKPLRGLLKEELAPLPDDYFENLKFKDHKTYQVPIKAIEKATGIKFDWKNVHFPFKAKAFKAVEVAKRARNVYAFNDFMEASSTAGLKGLTTPKGKLINKPIPKAKLEALVKKGFAASLKRYDLKGITL